MVRVLKVSLADSPLTSFIKSKLTIFAILYFMVAFKENKLSNNVAF